ncbi:MAG: flagellar export protein FliJ [Pseudomonadota bacterium]
MRQFKFKLQALLRMREFKEDRVKVEMGKIVQNMNQIREQIAKINHYIDEGHEAYAHKSEDKDGARYFKFIGEFIHFQRAALKQKEKEMREWQAKYDTKIQELEVAMGEVKVIENIKEKRFGNYRKELNKKMEEDVQEVAIMRSGEQKD